MSSACLCGMLFNDNTTLMEFPRRNKLTVAVRTAQTPRAPLHLPQPRPGGPDCNPGRTAHASHDVSTRPVPSSHADR
jgi:hypothetical protein